MESFRELLDVAWFEKCARHTSSHTARTQQFGFYCDDCARRLTAQAFNGRAPMHHGETVSGTCGLCNRPGLVTLRTWFVCTICWGVVTAYQKSMVSTMAIHHFWRTMVKPEFPDIDLNETDEIRIEPFARKAKTKKEGAKSLASLDFVASRANELAPATPLFHVEQKTGPGSIESMKEFQLDVNDYDDVLGVVLNTGIPAYVLHVQVGQEYENGTRRVVTQGMWWTDIVRLRGGLRSVKGRRGEDKKAAYFKPDVFQPMDFFLRELREKRYLKLAEDIRSLDLGLPG